MTFRLWRCITCSLTTLGHKLSDEVLGSPLASILFNLEIFSLVGDQKMQKKHFLLSGKLLLIFWSVNKIKRRYEK